MSDEHTRSVMGAYGNQLVQTPVLDRLAARGVRFDNAYTPSPICIPARASFATGSQVFEHRCWSSAEPYYGQQQSWMYRLREQGHEVVSIGKLHYRSAGEDHGFSREILPMYVFNNGNGWVQGLVRKPLGDFPDARELAATIGPGETEYTKYDRDITAAAVDWLHTSAGRQQRPWVLFVSFICPHYPLSAPVEFFDLYRDIELPAPYDSDREQCLKHPVIDEMRRFWNYPDYFHADDELLGLRNYYGLCSFLDSNIGQVLTALEHCGQSERTQIVYTSDHGDMIGNHGIWAKSYMYEDSVGIPMVLAGHGIEAGVNKTPVSLTDIAATAEHVVRGSTSRPDDEWRSRPLHDFIETPDYERLLLSEYHDGGSPCGFYLLRRGRWKLVYFAEGHAPLLFDLESDPRELNDLAGNPDFAAIKTELIQQLTVIVDPEAANREAFADQARVIERLGGIDRVLAMPTFNHTPVESA